MDIDEVVIINNMFNDLMEAEEIQVGQRQFYARENAFTSLSDTAFIKMFRLSKQLTRNLINVVTDYVEPPSRQSALNIEIKVLIALHFFGQGSYQGGVGKNLFLGVSQSSVSRAITEVANVLNRPNVMSEFIKFPENVQQLEHLRTRFYRKYGFPGIIGCIDGTHVAIVKSNNNEHVYINRKNYHSLNVQLVCDESLKIINVNARFPGSSHDVHVWRNSQISNVVENIYRNVNDTFFLMGDLGYPLRPWLLTPFQNPLPGSVEERCSNRMKMIRSSIERCNGLLKNRFRCLLRHRTLHYQPETAAKIVNACCVLHNMCIDNNIPAPDDNDIVHMDFGLYNNEGAPDEVVNAVNPDLEAGRHLRQRLAEQYFNVH